MLRLSSYSEKSSQLVDKIKSHIDEPFDEIKSPINELAVELIESFMEDEDRRAHEITLDDSEEDISLPLSRKEADYLQKLSDEDQHLYKKELSQTVQKWLNSINPDYSYDEINDKGITPTLFFKRRVAEKYKSKKRSAEKLTILMLHLFIRNTTASGDLKKRKEDSIRYLTIGFLAIAEKQQKQPTDKKKLDFNLINELITAIEKAYTIAIKSPLPINAADDPKFKSDNQLLEELATATHLLKKQEEQVDSYLPKFINAILDYENPGDLEFSLLQNRNDDEEEIEIPFDDYDRRIFKMIDDFYAKKNNEEESAEEQVRKEKINYKNARQKSMGKSNDPNIIYIPTQSGATPHYTFIKIKRYKEERQPRKLPHTELQKHVKKIFSGKNNAFYMARQWITQMDHVEKNKNMLSQHYETMEQLTKKGVANKDDKIKKYDGIKNRLKVCILIECYSTKTVAKEISLKNPPPKNLGNRRTKSIITASVSNEISSYENEFKKSSATHSRQARAQAITTALAKANDDNETIALLYTHYATIKSTQSLLSKKLESILLELLEDSPIDQSQPRANEKKADCIFLQITQKIVESPKVFELIFSEKYMRLAHRLIELDRDETGITKFFTAIHDEKMAKKYHGIHEELYDSQQPLPKTCPSQMRL